MIARVETRDRFNYVLATGAFRIPLHRLDADKPWWRRQWRGYAWGVNGDKIQDRLMPYVEWAQHDGTYRREPV